MKEKLLDYAIGYATLICAVDTSLTFKESVEKGLHSGAGVLIEDDHWDYGAYSFYCMPDGDIEAEIPGGASLDVMEQETKRQELYRLGEDQPVLSLEEEQEEQRLFEMIEESATLATAYTYLQDAQEALEKKIKEKAKKFGYKVE